jgi:DNA-binding FrmR family transcriptional regulator
MYEPCKRKSRHRVKNASAGSKAQVRGLSKMVEDERYCIDIVTQISAVRAALRRFEEEVLKDHVSHCVEHAIASGDKSDQRKKIAELMAVIGRAER